MSLRVRISFLSACMSIVPNRYADRYDWDSGHKEGERSANDNRCGSNPCRSTYWQHLVIRAKLVSASLCQLPLTNEWAKCWFPTGSTCYPAYQS